MPQKVGIGAGNVDLPELPDGLHYLTIYLYGLNMRNYDPQFKSYVYTSYFSIDDPNSIFIPTPSPTLTPSPSPSLTPTSSLTPSLSPSSSPSPSLTPASSPTQQTTLEPTSGLSSAPRISPIKEVDYLGWLWAAIIVAIFLIIASMVYLATLGKIRNRK